MSLPPALGLILAGLVGAAAVRDVRTGRIPNRFLLSIAGLGIAARLVLEGGTAGLWALAGIGTGLAVWIGPFALRWVGAADVKLVGAIGAWLGPLLTLKLSLYAALAGGLMSLGYLVVTRRFVALQAIQLQLAHFSLTRRLAPGSEAAVRERGMPYALAILAALLAGMLVDGWVV